MDSAVYSINLDIEAMGSQAVLMARQGDNTRSISASLRQNELPYIIPPGCIATLVGSKPDGTILYNDCRIEDNKIIYDFTPQTASTPGRVKCEIRIYNAEQLLLTSPRFIIQVLKQAVSDQNIISRDEVTELTKLIADCLKILEAAKNGKFNGKDGASLDITGARPGQVAKVKAVDENGKPTEWEPADMTGGGGGTSFSTDESLSLTDGVLKVNTVQTVEKDNTLPVSSAAVFTEVGNIEALLATI